MVRFHGSILRETGKIFSRQADILEQTCQASVGGWQNCNTLAPNLMEMEARENSPAGNNVKLEMLDKEAVDVEEKKVETDLKEEKKEMKLMEETKEMIAQSVKREKSVSESTSTEVEKLSVCLFSETEDLLKGSAWDQVLEQYLPTEDAIVELCLPSRPSLSHMSNRKDVFQREEAQWGQERESEGQESCISYNGAVPADLEMRFTREEMNNLWVQKVQHEGVLKRVIREELLAARVANFLGKLSTEQMMTVFATGRKAQNYYHYLSMTNSAYFDMLTTNTQRKLMHQKTLICYSLNVALWFFGHNATTAMGQEDSTGMDTGMKDYLTVNHPDLLDKLTPNYYDEIFVVPWATNREVEETHKDLLQSVGKTLKALDFNGYLLLYGICLYTIDSQTLSSMNVPQHDEEVIRKAEAYFSLMYRRYLKQMVGWKRAMEVQLNQRCLIEKLQKAVTISSRNNLHCNDLSDYSTINAVDAPKQQF